MNSILTAVTVVLYLSGAALLLRRIARGFSVTDTSKYLPIGLGLAGIVLHGVLLYSGIVAESGLNLTFFNALSLTAWLIALIVLLSGLTQPVENLAIAILPIATLILLLDVAIGAPPVVTEASAGLKGHILLSILSYSLLAIAALQAGLLAIQDRHLRNRHPGGFIRALPPLETMETLLFQMIGTGYILLSLALISGAHFVENLYTQHLVHKTVLSIAAWVVFAILLWGRLQFGWRGRVAIRWTLTGFGALMLAYFGSKLVLELVLAR